MNCPFSKLILLYLITGNNYAQFLTPGVNKLKAEMAEKCHLLIIFGHQIK